MTLESGLEDNNLRMPQFADDCEPTAIGNVRWEYASAALARHATGMVFVSTLELNEQRVTAVLDEVCDVRASQPIEIQGLVEAEGIAVGDESGVDPLQPDPVAALGGPQRRRAGHGQSGPELGDPLVQDLGKKVAVSTDPQVRGRI